MTNLKKWLPGIWFIDPPKDISLDGYRIDNVIQYTDFVITLYYGIVVAALVFFVWKYNSRKHPKAAYEHGNEKKHLIMTVVMGMISGSWELCMIPDEFKIIKYQLRSSMR